MVSVIIPTLNEARTISAVVEFARRDPWVTEVVVVDDGSIDGTPELAHAAGARVITSTMLGKGVSMEEGAWAARGDVLLYLDGDLRGLRSNLIASMTGPVLDGRADFVKARFSRAAGRVTTLTARPLLRVFFPELAHLEQPLGGIVAARRSLLRGVRFETDYGVDVGLLLDVAVRGARVLEVDIGHIEHVSQPLEKLSAMADQVIRALLERAARYGRLRLAQIREVAEDERQAQAGLSAVCKKVRHAERLALFDMDGTLLDGRFVVSLARRANRGRDLAELLDNASVPADERTRRIAALFKGVPRQAFEEIARAMPLTPGAVETVVALRKAGYRVGIVTDSYRAAAEVVRRRVFADFCVAHSMRFRNGRATGEVTLSPVMAHPEGCPRHGRCKRNAMLHLTESAGITFDQVLAVGDSDNDVCMLESAGTSVAFQPKSPRVRDAAGFVAENSLAEVLSALPACDGFLERDGEAFARAA